MSALKFPDEIDGLGPRDLRLRGEKCKAHPRCTKETRTFYGGVPMCAEGARVEAIRRRYTTTVKGAQGR